MSDPRRAPAPTAPFHATPRPIDAAALPAWRRARLDQALLYICIDARRERDAEARAQGWEGPFPALRRDVRAALAGGVDIVQLRDKNSPGQHEYGPLEARAEVDALSIIRQECATAGALCAANDRADVALAAGVDVCHVGQDDLAVDVVRDIVGPDVLIGLSCHSPAEVDLALATANVDYFCTGPVWPTPTKPGRPAPGLPLVTHAHTRTGGGGGVGGVGGGGGVGGAGAKPWFAIGGIDPTTLPQVLDAGARRAVVVRAVTAAADIRAAAATIRASIADAAR